jgi:hypothetical protein
MNVKLPSQQDLDAVAEEQRLREVTGWDKPYPIPALGVEIERDEFQRLLERCFNNSRKPEPVKGEVYPWCPGDPTVEACNKRGYCRKDPNCGE